MNSMMLNRDQYSQNLFQKKMCLAKISNLIQKERFANICSTCTTNPIVFYFILAFLFYAVRGGSQTILHCDSGGDVSALVKLL